MSIRDLIPLEPAGEPAPRRGARRAAGGAIIRSSRFTATSTGCSTMSFAASACRRSAVSAASPRGRTSSSARPTRRSASSPSSPGWTRRMSTSVSRKAC